MKSVAIYISIIVVVLLNANFFKVYSSLSKNDVQKNLIVQNGQRVLEAAKAAREIPSPKPSPTAAPESPTPSPTVSPTLIAVGSTNSPGGIDKKRSGNNGGDSSGKSTETPSPAPTPVDIKKEAERTKQDINVYVNTYQEFGFAPLSLEQTDSFLWSTGIWTGLTKMEDGKRPWWGATMLRDAKGRPLSLTIDHRPVSDCRETDDKGDPIKENGNDVDCSNAWRAQTRTEWWDSRKHDVSVVVGWGIMVLLLSVGAPFWQDTLESLFGVKNLLRQKSGTQNIESQSGSGNQKQ